MAYRGSFPFAASAYHFGQRGAPGNALTRGRRQERQETPAQRIARLRREESQRRMQSMNPAGMPARQGMPVTQKGWDAAYGGVPDFKSIIQQRGQRDIAARPITASPLAPVRISQQRQRQQQQPFVPTEPSFADRYAGALGDAGVAATRAATTSPTNPVPSFIRSITEAAGQFTKSFTENERYLAEKAIQEEERFKADQFRDYQMDIGRAGEGRAVEEHELTMEAYEDKQEAQRRIATIFKGLGENPTNEQIFQALQKAVNEAYAAGDTGIAQAINTNMELYTTDQGDRFTAPYDMYDREGNSYTVMTDKQTLENYRADPDKGGQLVKIDTSRMRTSPFPAGTTGSGTTQSERANLNLLQPALHAIRDMRKGDGDMTMAGGTRIDGGEGIARWEILIEDRDFADQEVAKAEASGDPEAIRQANIRRDKIRGDLQAVIPGIPKEALGEYMALRQVRDDASAEFDRILRTGNKDRIERAEQAYFEAGDALVLSQFEAPKLFSTEVLTAYMAEMINQNQGQSSGWLPRLVKTAALTFMDNLDDQAIKKLEDYTSALNFINPIVRFLSGAQMTNQEAMRYYQALIPVPGEPLEVSLLKRRKRQVLADAMGGEGVSDERQRRAKELMGLDPDKSAGYDEELWKPRGGGTVPMSIILNGLNNSVGTLASAYRMAGKEMGPQLGQTYTPQGPIGDSGIGARRKEKEQFPGQSGRTRGIGQT